MMAFKVTPAIEVERAKVEEAEEEGVADLHDQLSLSVATLVEVGPCSVE